MIIEARDHRAMATCGREHRCTLHLEPKDLQAGIVTIVQDHDLRKISYRAPKRDLAKRALAVLTVEREGNL